MVPTMVVNMEGYFIEFSITIVFFVFVFFLVPQTDRTKKHREKTGRQTDRQTDRHRARGSSFWSFLPSSPGDIHTQPGHICLTFFLTFTQAGPWIRPFSQRRSAPSSSVSAMIGMKHVCR
mgnify:CR=1 FL=1